MGSPARRRRTSNNNLPPNDTANFTRMPGSGTESPYINTTFGTRKGVGNNNCYGYAIDAFREHGEVKLQPGDLSGMGNTRMDLATCTDVVARAAADLRQRGYAADPDKPCKRGYHKIMSFLSPGEDYHWYKQHKDAIVSLSSAVPSVTKLARVMGVHKAQVYAPTASPRAGDTVMVKNAGVWSHKQGLATGPLLKDACGKAIKDPRKACRKYSPRLDYKKYCGAFCVKSRQPLIIDPL